MRILYLIDSLRVGGAESVVFNLIQEFSKIAADLDPAVVVLYTPGHIGSQLQAGGVPVRSLDAPRLPGPQYLARLARWIREGDYDLVHTHLFPANYVVGLLSLLGTRLPPLVHTEHSVWNRRRKFRAARLIESRIYDRFACVIGVSASVSRALGDWLPAIRPRLRLIPNGVCVPAKAREGIARQNARHQILFVGSLRAAKGVDTLLRAVALLQGTDYRLEIVGEGPLRGELEDLCRSLGLQDRVQFQGLCADVASFMQRADCMVLPSRWEGLPMVVLESMAAGCPVIATPVGGIPEVIEDGVTGWLVPPDEPRALAETLAAVLGDPTRRFGVAEAALALVEQRYSIAQAASQTLACYREVLAAAR